jgi:hypothetical protein
MVTGGSQVTEVSARLIRNLPVRAYCETVQTGMWPEQTYSNLVAGAYSLNAVVAECIHLT